MIFRRGSAIINARSWKGRGVGWRQKFSKSLPENAFVQIFLTVNDSGLFALKKYILEILSLWKKKTLLLLVSPLQIGLHKYFQKLGNPPSRPEIVPSLSLFLFVFVSWCVSVSFFFYSFISLSDYFLTISTSRRFDWKICVILLSFDLSWFVQVTIICISMILLINLSLRILIIGSFFSIMIYKNSLRSIFSFF